MGKLRKSRSRHAIPGSSIPTTPTSSGPTVPPISQPAAPSISAATATASSPIALKTSRPSAAAITSYNHDDSSVSGSPVPTAIDFNVGSPGSSYHQGETTPHKGGRPKSVVSKQSSSSLRSSDKDQQHHYSTPPKYHQHTDTESIFSNSDAVGMTASTSASALSLLRERLHEDEAARKRRIEEEAEKAAGPRKLHKKRGPSEANSPPGGIAEETASVAEAEAEPEAGEGGGEAAVAQHEEEDSKKVTQKGHQTPTPEASPEMASQSSFKQQLFAPPPLTEVQPIRSRWIPTMAIPRPQAVFDYATATARSTASTAFRVATLPVTIPLNIARQVPLIRVFVPAIKQSSTPTPPRDDTQSTNGHDGADTVPHAKAKAVEAKDDSAGLVWKTAELGVGLGIAAVLVGAAGADYAYQSVFGWRKKQAKPAGIIH